MFKFKSKFGKEITLILLIKVIAITVIGVLCFSHPVSKRLTDDSMIKHFVV